jgi:hypothetical protein
MTNPIAERSQRDAAVLADHVLCMLVKTSMYDNETLELAKKYLSRDLGTNTPEEQAVVEAVLALIDKEMKDDL